MNGTLDQDEHMYLWIYSCATAKYDLIVTLRAVNPGDNQLSTTDLYVTVSYPAFSFCWAVLNGVWLTLYLLYRRRVLSLSSCSVFFIFSIGTAIDEGAPGLHLEHLLHQAGRSARPYELLARPRREWCAT